MEIINPNPELTYEHLRTDFLIENKDWIEKIEKQYKLTPAENFKLINKLINQQQIADKWKLLPLHAVYMIFKTDYREFLTQNNYKHE